MRTSRRTSSLVAGVGAAVAALSSVAWACTAHFGTISVCASPNPANLSVSAGTGFGAGCTANQGDGGMDKPGLPYQDSTAFTSPVKAQPGANLAVAFQTWPNNSDYTIRYREDPTHTACHESTSQLIWSGKTDMNSNGVHTGTKAVTWTIPPASTYTGVAWVCFQENMSTRTGSVTGYNSPYTVPDPEGIRGDLGVLSDNGPMGMAVPLSII